jgi:hypothetical protein
MLQPLTVRKYLISPAYIPFMSFVSYVQGSFPYSKVGSARFIKFQVLLSGTEHLQIDVCYKVSSRGLRTT